MRGGANHEGTSETEHGCPGQATSRTNLAAVDCSPRAALRKPPSKNNRARYGTSYTVPAIYIIFGGDNAARLAQFAGRLLSLVVGWLQSQRHTPHPGQGGPPLLPGPLNPRMFTSLPPGHVPRAVTPPLGPARGDGGGEAPSKPCRAALRKAPANPCGPACIGSSLPR